MLTRKNDPQPGDLPTLEKAETLLADSASLNPGPWVSHSRHVAAGARIIAAQCSGIDPQRAYILELLHDIGRRFGVTGMRHALDGCQFLTRLGYPAAARICLTHSYPVKNQPHGATPWDGSQAQWQFVEDYLAGIEYDDYDRLIQLCDTLALPAGFCLLEKRLLDVTMRYGCDDWTVLRWKAFFEIKAHFENQIHGSIYRLLPGVSENTFDL
jgi:hypothetical protein